MSLESPNWDDYNDRKLYNELFYTIKENKVLTEQEKEFCKTMYHMEEYASGLDGDR